ncbi:small, acid-soluble spore protein K [Sediminibacillus dalangtanensis]|uniref:Small, acid-soluble spore protein K n=1 Tax=Sediminibacillus dalangtanensis TaxID=2729421 RepID=A0ABX7VXE7_9BACI|nr:small acid-soluble spore protein K [Sediminibacillus dalangtanensis]QTN01357.1 small, acid-soluble spore protein K [Sediminibacillus dalangtanensis]
MRNKKYGLPDMRMDSKPRAKGRYSPKRADGSINTEPQERMKNSAHR